jgi:probable F420-dependent oxidoreductase
MELGAHLPIIAFDGRPWSLARLRAYASTASRLGFKYLCVNDHLVFRRPWLDTLAALSAVIAESGPMRLVTSVALPVVRGPVTLAKALAALDVLSGGRLIVGLGAGSSARDYAAVGVPFEERWPRFDEAVRVVRALLRRDAPPFTGRFYSTEESALEPLPQQEPGPPIWIGSWGSEAGLRRAARFGDGWLASAYNTTPERFAAAWQRVGEILPAVGKSPTTFANGLSTMYCHITEDRSTAERLVRDVLGPALNRAHEELSSRLLFGPANQCVEKLVAYREAGVQRVFLWPVGDEEEQLEVASILPLSG